MNVLAYKLYSVFQNAKWLSGCYSAAIVVIAVSASHH